MAVAGLLSVRPAVVRHVVLVRPAVGWLRMSTLHPRCVLSDHGADGRGREADALIPPSRYEAVG
jgi:hypothetical protein